LPFAFPFPLPSPSTFDYFFLNFFRKPLLDIRTRNGVTPLEAALQLGNYNAVQLYVGRADRRDGRGG
jgi:hypothetical protein